MSSIGVSSSPFVAPVAIELRQRRGKRERRRGDRRLARRFSTGRTFQDERPRQHADRLPSRVISHARHSVPAAEPASAGRRVATRHVGCFPATSCTGSEASAGASWLSAISNVTFALLHVDSALEYNSMYAARRSSSTYGSTSARNPLPRCRQAADNQIAHGQRLARHLPGIDVAHDAPAPALLVDDTEAQRVDARIEMTPLTKCSGSFGLPAPGDSVALVRKTPRHLIGVVDDDVADGEGRRLRAGAPIWAETVRRTF